MHKLGKDIYTNYNQSFDISDLCFKNEVKAILIGKSGVGKTTFLNNMCGTTQPAGISNNNITKQFYQGNCKYVEQQLFKIVDTPGTQIQGQKIKKKLENQAWNLILFETKLYSRFQITIEKLYNFYKAFKNNKNHIVFLISYLDIVTEKGQQQLKLFLQNFGRQMEDKLIQNPIFLFSRQNQNFQILAKVLFVLGNQNKPQKIRLQNKIFYKYFGISLPLQVQNQVEQNVNKQINQKTKQQIKEPTKLQTSYQQQNIGCFSLIWKCFGS